MTFTLNIGFAVLGFASLLIALEVVRQGGIEWARGHTRTESICWLVGCFLAFVSMPVCVYHAIEITEPPTKGAQVMNWKRLFNPWEELRQVKLRNAVLEQKCEDLWDRCQNAEDSAFHRASEHYYRRTRMMEEQLKVTQQQMIKMAAMTPPPPLLLREKPVDFGPNSTEEKC